jgi:hypothetical protein
VNLPTRMPLLSKHRELTLLIGLESKCACNGSVFMHSRPFLPGETFSGMIQTRSPFGSSRDAGDNFPAKTSIHALHSLLSGKKAQSPSRCLYLSAPSSAGNGSRFCLPARWEVVM